MTVCPTCILPCIWSHQNEVQPQLIVVRHVLLVHALVGGYFSLFQNSPHHCTHSTARTWLGFSPRVEWLSCQWYIHIVFHFLLFTSLILFSCILLSFYSIPSFKTCSILLSQGQFVFPRYPIPSQKLPIVLLSTIVVVVGSPFTSSWWLYLLHPLNLQPSLNPSPLQTLSANPPPSLLPPHIFPPPHPPVNHEQVPVGVNARRPLSDDVVSPLVNLVLLGTVWLL